MFLKFIEKYQKLFNEVEVFVLFIFLIGVYVVLLICYVFVSRKENR